MGRQRTLFMGFILLLLCICSISSPVSASGSVITEGDSILKTDQVRTLTGADGSGIVVGVISNGAKGLADAKKSGDLPDDVIILLDGRYAEGTAMMEIIHDLAPNATLLYHDFGFGTKEKFIEAFANLIAAGADIIVEDVGNFEVPYFEDGTIASGVSELIQNNPDVLIISAAGNMADKHYQGNFSNSGDGTHSFEGSTGIPVKMQPDGVIIIDFQWDDPFNNPQNDFDIYLYDIRENQEIVQSAKEQDTFGNPYENIRYQNKAREEQDLEIRIRLMEGQTADSAKLKLFIRYTFDKVRVEEDYLVSHDSIIGQSSLPGIISVATVSSQSDMTIQKFSSQGIVTISNPVPEIRKKPDITGVDVVQVTGSGGFKKIFDGTSAAAPHIAGLMALVWSVFPELSAEELKEALFVSALDLGEPGWDPIYGYGLADALAMVQYLEEQGKVTTPVDSNLTRPDVTIVPPDSTTPITPDDKRISGPVVLSTPGRYSLTNDITDFSEAVIVITGSDIHLNGAGNTLKGASVWFGLEAPMLTSGILIWSPDNQILSNISITGVNVTSTYSGISIRNAKDITIEGCGFTYNSKGVDIMQSQGVSIRNCIFMTNGQAGIVSDAMSRDLIVENSHLIKNLYGIVLDGSSGCQLAHNTISYNYYDGIRLNHGSSQNRIDNNLCTFNRNGGISLYSSSRNEVTNNTCHDNNPSGILLYESSENLIGMNRLYKNIRGLNSYYSNTNTITRNEIIGNDATGIMLQPSGHNAMKQNLIIGNIAEGILITNTVRPDEQNLIADNYFENYLNVRLQEGGNPNYQWNEPLTTAVNVIGGELTGGNVWADPTGTGFSQTCQDNNNDGVCDLPYSPVSGNRDDLPIKYTGPSLTPEDLLFTGPLPEPQTADEFVTRGKILMGIGDYPGAIEAYDNAIALSPTNYQAWRDKGLSLKEMKLFDEAFSVFDSLLQIYPERGEVYSTIGAIYLVDLQQYSESVPFYEKAVSLDSKDVHALVNLAFAYDRIGRSEEALDLYGRALELNPSLSDAWNKAANILTRAGRYDEAVQMFYKALELSPSNSFVWNNLGYTLYLSGKFPEAVDAYQKAVSIDPGYATAWKNLGAVYQAMGRIADSEAAYAQAM